MTAKLEAEVYRMVLPEHTCPFGVRAKELLTAAGYNVRDHILRSREEVEAFEREHRVSTTPLISIQGRWIGGCDDVESYLMRNR